MAERRHVAGDEGNPGAWNTSIRMSLGLQRLNRDGLARGIQETHVEDARLGKPDVRLRKVGSGPTQGIEDCDRDARAARVNSREDVVEQCFNRFITQPLRELVAMNRVLVDL